MKYVIHACSNKNCVCYTEWGGSCSHKLLGSGEVGTQTLQCDKCGSTSWRDAPPRTKSIQRRSWPYYNESAGVTFESDSHEQKYVKTNNLEAL